MGDIINKLPIDEKLDITNTDKSNLIKFFNADINTFAQHGQVCAFTDPVVLHLFTSRQCRQVC